MAATNGSMKRSSLVDSSASIDYPGIGVALGGILGFAGVYLNWWRYEYPVTGGTITQYLHGTEDWTGQVAFIAGIGAFAFALAYMLMTDPQIRKITGALMGISSIFLLAATLVGFFRVDAATANPVLLGVPAGETVQVGSGLAGGIYVSFIGGVFAVVGTILAIRRPGDGTVVET
jgi:hypothetical protein